MNDQQQQFDELDRQLRDWAQQRSRGEEQLDALRSRIVDEAMRPLSAPVETPAALAAATGTTLRWLGGCLVAGLAAALLLMFARPQPQPTEPPAGDVAEVDPPAVSAPEGAGWEAGQLQGKSMLAAELEQLFPEQWQWIVESGGDSSIQVGDAASRQDQRAVAVRISVVKRATGETQWTPVWTADCVSRCEELVQFESAAAGHASSLLLWAYPVNGNLVAVDCNLVLGDKDAMQSNYSVVQPRGVPTQASAVRRGDTEYAVFQTVSLLDGEASL